jgi:hypothetical protein
MAALLKEDLSILKTLFHAEGLWVQKSIATFVFDDKIKQKIWYACLSETESICGNNVSCLLPAEL